MLRGLFALLVLCGVCLSVISYHAFWKMCIIRRENTLEYSDTHSLPRYKTLEQNDHTREAAHTHSPPWSLCELTPVPHTAHHTGF